MKILSVVVLTLGLFVAVASQAAETKGVCKKNEKNLAVAGKSDAEMKAACEKAGGKWAEASKTSALGNGVGNGAPH